MIYGSAFASVHSAAGVVMSKLIHYCHAIVSFTHNVYAAKSMLLIVNVFQQG